MLFIKKHIISFSGRRACIFLTALLLAFASGCSLMPERELPPEGDLPEAFAGIDITTNAVEAPDEWWLVFESSELNELMETAFSDNLSLRQAWARLAQAGALAVQAESSLFPQISADAGFSYDYRRTTQKNYYDTVAKQIKDMAVQTLATELAGAVANQWGVPAPSGSGTGGISTTHDDTTRVISETRNLNLGLNVSYEVDLWGRIRHSATASRLEQQASREDLETTALTLASEVVTRWLSILELQEQARILREQLETNETYLELVELRFRKGKVSALDVYQQRQAVSGIAKRIPLILAQEEVTRHELALLLGKPPAAAINVGEYDLDNVPPIPETGIPADLLIMRPDVRAGLQRLMASDHRVASAIADRLPAIILSGNIGFGSSQMAWLFDDWFANLSAGITAPLFDGFRREAEVERTKMVVEERLAAYRLTVLTAIREVEDALVLEKRQREYMKALEQQLDDANNALTESSQRYQKGLNDYLPVLTALQGAQSLSRDVITARRELLTYRVNLYRALGGCWASDLNMPDDMQKDLKLSVEQTPGEKEMDDHEIG